MADRTALARTLLKVDLPPSATPSLPGPVSLPGSPTPSLPEGVIPMPMKRPGGQAPEEGVELDPMTGAYMDPEAYEGSLLGKGAQGLIKRQVDEATGGRDFQGERLGDLRSAGVITQAGRDGTASDAISTGFRERNAERIADLERKIFRDEPLYQAKAQARAAKSLLQSENIRFKNWTIRQQQKLQKLQLEQMLEGEKDSLLGSIFGGILGVGGAVIGGIASGGNPAGIAAGFGIGNAAGQTAGRAI